MARLWYALVRRWPTNWLSILSRCRKNYSSIDIMSETALKNDCENHQPNFNIDVVRKTIWIIRVFKLIWKQSLPTAYFNIVRWASETSDILLLWDIEKIFLRVCVSVKSTKRVDRLKKNLHTQSWVRNLGRFVSKWRPF